jgi:3-hydroxybutyryl-CoA dehydrogenase
MGSGIAQTCAAAGYRTIVREVDERRLQAGITAIQGFLDDGVRRGKITAESGAKILDHIVPVTAIHDLKDCDIVVEAIVEQVSAKASAYVAVEEVVGADTILISNTSSLSITELAATTGRPSRFAGLHFFNPVPLMKIVEVIRGLETSDETFDVVMQFARSLGKQAIAAPDRPGFIVNRLLIPYLLDAIRAFEGGLGTLEDIDAGMKLGCGHPMGPFTLIDFIGLDTTMYIANIMFDEFRQPTYAPPPLLRRMVAAGRLGRKSGRGFYSYT